MAHLVPKSGQAPTSQVVEVVPAQPAPVPSNGSQAQIGPPGDQPVTHAGQPLTAGSSIQDLLNADPLVIHGKAEVPVEVSGLTGQSPAEAQAEEQAAQPPAESPVAESPEVPVETQAETPETPSPTPQIDEPALIQRLSEEKRGLLRLKGEQARQVGDLRSEISRQEQLIRDLQTRLDSGQAPRQAPRISPEELAAKLLEDPASVIASLVEPLVMAQTRQQTEAVLNERTQAWQQQALAEQQAVAPEVAKDLFRARHQITDDFDTWLTTDDGKAVNEIVFKDPMRRRALEGYRDDGDVVGMADVLSNALEMRRTGQRAAKARHTVTQERQRVEASRPAANPPQPTVSRPLVPKVMDLYDKSITPEQLIEWARTAAPYEND